MKRIIAGFSFLMLSLILAWLLREYLITTLFIPIILGALRLGQLINTVPQLVWWIILIVISLTLFFTRISLPSVRFLKRKTIYIPRGRIDVIDSLIKESDRGSTYSGQQLALMLINIHRKMNKREELNIHRLESELSKKTLPPELADYAQRQLGTTKNKRDIMAGRLSLEKAVRFLKEEGETL